MPLPNAIIKKENVKLRCAHPEPRIRSIDLPFREAVVIVQHDHVLSSLAHRVGRVVLHEAKVVRELQAAGSGAHEDDARVLSLGEQGHKVLDARGRAGGVSGHG